MGVLLKMGSIFSPCHFWGTANLNLNPNLNLNLNRNFNFAFFTPLNKSLKTSILTQKLTKRPHNLAEKLGHLVLTNFTSTPCNDHFFSCSDASHRKPKSWLIVAGKKYTRLRSQLKLKSWVMTIRVGRKVFLCLFIEQLFRISMERFSLVRIFKK